MADLMTFPNTVEEFMEQYKIVDTEQVYTNGAELVPIFRMKQWFEHLPTADVRENVHARWLPYEFGNERWHKCSACGKADEYINERGIEAVRKYCPNCGAIMSEALWFNENVAKPFMDGLLEGLNDGERREDG